MTRLDVLPSAICTASAPRIGLFRGSMAGLCAPLSTLRRNPRGQLRMTRGRCGSLLLHRKRLALSTPCRSPGASHNESAIPPKLAVKADVADRRKWLQADLACARSSAHPRSTLFSRDGTSPTRELRYSV